MSTQAAPPGAASFSPWPAVAGAVALLTVTISLLLTAFAWPSVRSSVHDVPIAVAGPAPAVKQLTAVLDRRLPDGFEVTEVADAAAAEQLIRDRKVYGAIDLSSGTPQVITASAGSTAVAQALNTLAAGLTKPPGANTEVTARDLVPLPADDPRGAGLAAAALPLVMGGLLTALLLPRLVRGSAHRIIGAFAFAITGGLAVAAILQFWFGSLDGSYWANSAAVALTVAATSLTVLGLASLLGYAGFGLGAATMVLIGNPLSGTATAPEMLPGWSGTLGQLLPPGAGGRLLRSTSFFNGHDATHPATVLTAWLTLGTVLYVAGSLRTRPTGSVTNTVAQPAKQTTI
ncbi:hypothetical protein ACFYU9_05410 [Streptomyces sp. NPDC004327]|uniref:hypothetical protein n=1 Tax=Streptomyces sp. NPDC004327 TaxID=3364699 RepID=UPI00368A25FD